MKFNLINGNIITLDKANPNAHSLSVENGKIKLINEINKRFDTIDLKGATVIPGFIDSHFHITNLGKRLDMLQLKECKSFHEIGQMVL